MLTSALMELAIHETVLQAVNDNAKTRAYPL